MIPAKILVVEDEAIVALDIENQLEALGYRVAALAVSGEEAIRQVAETEPDLVLMDICLRGEMDGIQATEHISCRFGIPVIYLTAHADTETLARAKITGPYGYIIKPFEERELRTAIEIALYKHQVEREKREYARQLEHEIAERKRVEEALRQSETLYRTLIDTSPDAIVLTDLEGRILKANPPTAHLLGFASAEAVSANGKTAFDWLMPEDRQRALDDLQRNIENGPLKGLVYTFLKQDATPVPVEASVSVLVDSEGFPEALIGVVRDITARQQAEAQAIELAREKERVSIMSTLVHQMAHDLRTPLSTMSTSIYLLRQTSNPDRREHHLNLLSAQVTHLTDLLDSVLYMAQLDTGVQFDRNSVDLVRVIREVLIREDAAISAKNLNCVLDLTPTTIPVWADERRLHRAVLEIIDNAIRYTATGGVIRVHAWSQTGLAVLEVQDTGEGMSQATQERIFERFYKGDESRSDRTGGGLGLAIAKKIVGLHGGQIEVASTLGQGSAFRILLPAYDPGSSPDHGVQKFNGG